MLTCCHVDDYLLFKGMATSTTQSPVCWATGGITLPSKCRHRWVHLNRNRKSCKRLLQVSELIVGDAVVLSGHGGAGQRRTCVPCTSHQKVMRIGRNWIDVTIEKQWPCNDGKNNDQSLQWQCQSLSISVRLPVCLCHSTLSISPSVFVCSLRLISCLFRSPPAPHIQPPPAVLCHNPSC